MKDIPKKLLIAIFPLATLQWFGSSFSYDYPQVFEAVRIQRMQIDAFKVQFLYSIGSFPNFFSNIIASMMLPKLGVGYIVLFFQTTVFIGSALTYLAVRINSYGLICVGRIFIGISFDVCLLGMILCCEKWFRGKILSVSLSIGRFMGLMGTSSSYYLLPTILLDTRSIENSSFCCVVASFVVFAFTALFAVIDIKNEHLLKTNTKGENGDEEEEIQKAIDQADGDQKLLGSKIVSAASMIKEKDFTFKHAKYISLKSWILLIYLVLAPTIYYQFTNTGSDFLMVRYGFTYEEAKNTLSLLPFISALLLPFAAAMYTKFGFKPVGMLASNLFGLAAYSYLAILPTSGESSKVTVCIILIAFFYALNYGCMWSSFLISLPKEASGLCVGFALTMMKGLFGTVPLFTGWLYRDRSVRGYQNWVYFMTGFSVFVTLCAVWVLIIDARGDRLLIMPENDPRVFKIQQKMSNDFKNSVLSRGGDGASKRPKTEYATLAGQTASKTWKSNLGSNYGTKFEEVHNDFSQQKSAENVKDEPGEDDLP